MNPAERRVRLQRRIRDRREAANARAVTKLEEAAQPYLDAGRPDLAAPYLETAELFASAYSGRSAS